MRDLQADGYFVRSEDLAQVSPYQTRRLKRFGDYALSMGSPDLFDTDLACRSRSRTPRIRPRPPDALFRFFTYLGITPHPVRTLVIGWEAVMVLADVRGLARAEQLEVVAWSARGRWSAQPSAQRLRMLRPLERERNHLGRHQPGRAWLAGVCVVRTQADQPSSTA